MDVNVEKAEDILMHMNLLEDARNPAKQPSFLVRLVHVRIFFHFVFSSFF